MAAKTIRLSDDGGTTYYTLPGNTGDISNEAGVLDDTIFGQNFKSEQPNLINWNISANAIYKGFAGYQVCIKQGGTPVPFTDEPMSVESGTTYVINDLTKNLWDLDTAIVVEDDGTPIPTQVVSIDYLYGKITLDAGYAVVGAITVTGASVPLALLARYRSFSLTQTADAIDESDVPSARTNGGHMLHDYGLRTVGIDVSGVYALSNGYRQALIDRDVLVIEINPDGNNRTVARGYFRILSEGQTGDVGDLEEETVSFSLSVPATEKLATPFAWQFNSSDLSTSVIKAIEAWQDSEVLKARYLPDGTTGVEGDIIVTDISLEGGLESMNEFTVSLLGTGALTNVT